MARTPIGRVFRPTRKKLTETAVRNFDALSQRFHRSRLPMSLRITRKLFTNSSFLIRRFRRNSSKKTISRFLPVDLIVQSVLPRLSALDYIRCRLVCSSWLAGMDNAIASRRHCPFLLLPWLFIRSHQLSLEDHRFLSLNEDHRIYKTNPAYNMNKLNCVGSVEDWLVMVNNALWCPPNSILKCFFLNPISGHRVMLPSECTIKLPGHDNRQYFYLYKEVASSVPTNPDCVVAATVYGGQRYRLALCRPASRSWTLTEFGGDDRIELKLRDIEIINGKLYAATWDALEFLMVFDISTFPSSTLKAEKLVMLQPSPVASRFLDVNFTMNSNGVKYTGTKRDDIYLAKDSTLNQLYMIFQRSSYAPPRNSIINHQQNILGGNFSIPPQ